MSTLREAAQAAAEAREEKVAKDNERSEREAVTRLRYLLSNFSDLKDHLEPEDQWVVEDLPEDYVTSRQSQDSLYYRKCVVAGSIDGTMVIRVVFEVTTHSGWKAMKQVLVEETDGEKTWVPFNSLAVLHDAFDPSKRDAINKVMEIKPPELPKPDPKPTNAGVARELIDEIFQGRASRVARKIESAAHLGIDPPHAAEEMSETTTLLMAITFALLECAEGLGGLYD